MTALCEDRRTPWGGDAADLSPDSCAVCGYLQRGLPAVHRCPECGFAYDSNTMVWRARRSAQNVGIWIGLFLFVFLVFWGLEGANSSSLRWTASPLLPGFQDRRLLVVSLLLVVAAARTIVAIRFHRIIPFAAVTEAGIWVRDGGAQPRLLPWSGIRGVAIRQVGDRAFTRLLWRDRAIVDVSGIISDPTDAAEFVQVVKRERARFDARSSSRSAGDEF